MTTLVFALLTSMNPAHADDPEATQADVVEAAQTEVAAKPVVAAPQNLPERWKNPARAVTPASAQGNEIKPEAAETEAE